MRRDKLKSSASNDNWYLVSRPQRPSENMQGGGYEEASLLTTKPPPNHAAFGQDVEGPRSPSMYCCRRQRTLTRAEQRIKTNKATRRRNRSSNRRYGSWLDSETLHRCSNLRYERARAPQALLGPHKLNRSTMATRADKAWCSPAPSESWPSRVSRPGGEPWGCTIPQTRVHCIPRNPNTTPGNKLLLTLLQHIQHI